MIREALPHVASQVQAFPSNSVAPRTETLAAGDRVLWLQQLHDAAPLREELDVS